MNNEKIVIEVDTSELEDLNKVLDSTTTKADKASEATEDLSKSLDKQASTTKKSSSEVTKLGGSLSRATSSSSGFGRAVSWATSSLSTMGATTVGVGAAIVGIGAALGIATGAVSWLRSSLEALASTNAGVERAMGDLDTSTTILKGSMLDLFLGTQGTERILISLSSSLTEVSEAAKDSTQEITTLGQSIEEGLPKAVRAGLQSLADLLDGFEYAGRAAEDMWSRIENPGASMDRGIQAQRLRSELDVAQHQLNRANRELQVAVDDRDRAYSEYFGMSPRARARADRTLEEARTHSEALQDQVYNLTGALHDLETAHLKVATAGNPIAAILANMTRRTPTRSRTTPTFFSTGVRALGNIREQINGDRRRQEGSSSRQDSTSNAIEQERRAQEQRLAQAQAFHDRMVDGRRQFQANLDRMDAADRQSTYADRSTPELQAILAGNQETEAALRERQEGYLEDIEAVSNRTRELQVELAAAETKEERDRIAERIEVYREAYDTLANTIREGEQNLNAIRQDSAVAQRELDANERERLQQEDEARRNLLRAQEEERKASMDKAKSYADAVTNSIQGQLTNLGGMLAEDEEVRKQAREKAKIDALTSLGQLLTVELTARSIAAFASGNFIQGAGYLAAVTAIQGALAGAGAYISGAKKDVKKAKKEESKRPAAQGPQYSTNIVNNWGMVGDPRATSRMVGDQVQRANRLGYAPA